MASRSAEATRVLEFMIKKLSGTTYSYRNIVEGAYKTAIQNYGYTEPPERMEVIVDECIEIFNNMNISYKI